MSFLMALRMQALQNGIMGLEETTAAMSSLRKKALNAGDERTAAIAGHGIWWLNVLRSGAEEWDAERAE